MNNKAHLRPQDYDSNGDIIPMACKEEKGDLISREALKKALKESKYCGFYDKVIEIIDNAPTVEPKQGEWIEVDIKSTPYGGYTCNRKCNKCGYFTREYRLNFCPNCGAEMRGSEE